MKKITKILFSISSSFILIFLIIAIIRLANGKSAYFGISQTLSYIETFKGLEVFKSTLDTINSTIDSSFNNWNEFTFSASNMAEFFESIGVFFNNLAISITGVFKIIVFGLRGLWNTLWYVINFVISFIDYAISF